MAPVEAISIDVVSDFVCPWCYIGKRRLEQALAMRPDLAVAVTWRPFELSPDMPREGKDRYEHMLSIFGEERAKMVLENMSEMGRDDGIEMRYQPGSRSPNTLSAHVLSQLALTQGKQLAFSEAIFKAFFTDCADIGDHSTLIDLAVSVGMDKEQVQSELNNQQSEQNVTELIAQARAQGVTGVPFFIINNQYALSGAQPASSLVEVLDKLIQEVA